MAATTLVLVAELMERIFPDSFWAVASKALLGSTGAWTFAVAIARYVALGEMPEP